jgi:hypothetical protein
MRCTCGLENDADAKFCQSCGTALGSGPSSAISHAGASSSATLTLTEDGKATSRPRSRASMAIVVVVVVAVAAAGYWWLHRSPNGRKPDNSGLYPISVAGKYGFMDRSGETVIPPQFDETGGFSEELASVRIGTKFGYINTKGEVVITPQFDDAGPFRFGRAAVKLCCGQDYLNGRHKIQSGQDGKSRYGFIDPDGKYISTPDFLWVAQWFSGDFAPVKIADRLYGIMNRSGKVVTVANLEQVSDFGFADGVAPAAAGGKWGYIDTVGKWVIDPQFESAEDFSDGLAAVKVGGRWGYIDRKGKFVVNPQYDEAGEFEEGQALFKSGGRYGFIDTSGRVVVNATFRNARRFSDGLAPVKTDEDWGFLDSNGKMVINSQFDRADAFQGGLARVRVAGKEAYVTTGGAFVANPFLGQTGIPADASAVMAQPSSAVVIPTNTLLSRGFEFDNGSAPMCSIKGSAGPCQIQAFVFPELNQDPSAYTCSKLDQATYVGQCAGGALEGVSVVIADGTTKGSREAFVSYFSAGRIAYPALTAYLDGDDLNFGVREKGSSYGCVYFGRWDTSDTRDGCRKFKKFYGSDIFAETNARSLRHGSFNLSKYSTNFSRFMSGESGK